MIPKKAAQLIHLLPEGMVTYLSRKILYWYVNNYGNMTIEGSQNLTTITTPTILICNHLSNADGLVLAKVLKELDPTFVAGVKLTGSAVTNMGMNIVKTTNIKPNTADVPGLKKAIKLVKNGENLLIFPEGTRSRAGSLIEAKKGVLLIARMTGAPIVPIGIWGTEKLLPINAEGDMNAEKFARADVHVKIGEQFLFPKKAKDQSKQDYEDFATSTLMNKIAELLPEAYRGVYK